VFGDHAPAGTLVGVEALGAPEFLTEVEAIAVLDRSEKTPTPASYTSGSSGFSRPASGIVPREEARRPKPVGEPLLVLQGLEHAQS
jgi:hypothetical protein